MAAEVQVARPSRLARLLAGDIAWSFRRSPIAIGAALVLLVIALTALAAPLVSPQNPYDLKQLFLDKAELPPILSGDGEWPYLLGTDPQGRDVLSAILYGSRISLIIGFTFYRTKNLIPGIIAHGVFDAVQLFVVIPIAFKAVGV